MKNKEIIQCLELIIENMDKYINEFPMYDILQTEIKSCKEFLERRLTYHIHQKDNPNSFEVKPIRIRLKGLE